jgi:hypothetical protein
MTFDKERGEVRMSWGEFRAAVVAGDAMAGWWSKGRRGLWRVLVRPDYPDPVDTLGAGRLLSRVMFDKPVTLTGGETLEIDYTLHGEVRSVVKVAADGTRHPVKLEATTADAVAAIERIREKLRLWRSVRRAQAIAELDRIGVDAHGEDRELTGPLPPALVDTLEQLSHEAACEALEEITSDELWRQRRQVELRTGLGPGNKTPGGFSVRQWFRQHRARLGRSTRRPRCARSTW